MKNLKYLSVALLALAVIPSAGVFPTSAKSPRSQNQGSTALERGYRTGYSDGYQAGYKDVADRGSRDFRSKEDYQRADRAYVDAWGPIEDYRDGYQQGYEAGYASGYDRQSFDSTIPAGFKRRGAASSQSAPVVRDNPNPSPPTTSSSTPVNISGPVLIPRDTTLVVELQNALSSDVSQRGDRFEVRVLEPRDYQGATIDGHVTNVKRPGKVKGTAELQLSFDQIRMPDNRVTNMHAEVVEVLPSARSEEVGEVDREGGVKGRSSTKDDVTKVGAATGIGAIIGAIAGGGKGAAIGAAIGAGVGTGGVLSQRGKDIHLDRGQHLRIRTDTDTVIH